MAETNMQRAIRVLVSPAAELEQAGQSLLAMLSVNTALGVWLDLIGARVGQAREGVTDDEIYRRYIRARISANKSDGLTEDLITISRLVVFDEDATIVVRRSGTATVTVRVDDAAITEDVVAVLMRLLQRAVGAGVRLILEYTTVDPADALYWDTQGTWDDNVWWNDPDEEI